MALQILVAAVVSSAMAHMPKVETFELFWKGQPQRNPYELLRNCCGSTSLDFGVGTPSGLVLRPGQMFSFLYFNRTQQNGPILDTLRAGMNNIFIRYCYCSAFDECWVGTDQFGKSRDMHPPRVPMCPQPEVPYNNQRS